ncbi:MAG: FAD binding domain-containing protein [Myxococcota bacterium]
MKDFDYVLAKSVEDAARHGSAQHARFIAGGTLLVDLLRLNVERPELVVDLNQALSSEIRVEENLLRIGALARNSELAHHERVKLDYPALSEALLSGASPQIRNMASVGGNLLQRTRCAYFRDSAVRECNKRSPGAGCAALAGFTRMHAILGGSDRCIAAHPSDMCVALLALDATVLTQGPQGTRSIPIAELHTLPGDQPQIESVLVPGEIVTYIEVPRRPYSKRSAYVKARDRASFAFALASAAVALELDGGTIRAVRVALGGVATKPWRAAETEAALLGGPASEEAFQSAAKLAANGARTRPDNDFKRTLTERVVLSALRRAWKRA